MGSGEPQCSHLKNGGLGLKASEWSSGSETKDGTGTSFVLFPHKHCLRFEQALGWALGSIL